MSASVTCEKCKTADGLPTGIMYDGQIIATGILCDPCFALVLARAARFRDELDTLVADGVEPEYAIAIVRARISGNAPAA